MSRTFEKRTVEVVNTTSITCDKCGVEVDAIFDVFEAQEFLHIEFTCGYGSVFGDGACMSGDFCQNCVKELLGEYLNEDEC